jgi:hypothetical protein
LRVLRRGMMDMSNLHFSDLLLTFPFFASAGQRVWLG